ncbi:hypothetical protein PBAC_21840 [Pedobacter glucosidilyticus]|nr:hypothetical protein [Pedobacter glucosidilyticus]KHJ37591.1 hypothetical protein PBAC_21840 [Pedobacter glucosidilyticus]
MLKKICVAIYFICLLIVVPVAPIWAQVDACDPFDEVYNPDTDTCDPVDVPLDAGVGFLLAIGAAIGMRRTKER